MNLFEAMFVRKSVRNFQNEPITPQVMEDILIQFDDSKSLFGGLETELVIFDNRKKQYKRLEMFGVKAPYYLALYSEERDRAQMNAGYLMEQMSLYLYTIGLGSCFVGAPMVPRKLQYRGEKKLMTVLAFGKAKGSHIRKQAEAKRLELSELCVYKETPRQWMNQLLEAARMAPSSLNSQPWRFVVFDNRIHIYSKKRKVGLMENWDDLNFGIMFSHMMIAAEELWLDVDLIRLEELTQKLFPNTQYVLSAILRP